MYENFIFKLIKLIRCENRTCLEGFLDEVRGIDPESDDSFLDFDLNSYIDYWISEGSKAKK